MTDAQSLNLWKCYKISASKVKLLLLQYHRMWHHDNEKIRLVTISDQLKYWGDAEVKSIEKKMSLSTLESEIDHLVYELYGLTEEEIGIVEKSVDCISSPPSIT